MGALAVCANRSKNQRAHAVEGRGHSRARWHPLSPGYARRRHSKNLTFQRNTPASIPDLEWIFGLVEGQGSGSLFYDASSPRSGRSHPAKIASGRISEWIRSLGFVPVDIQPSHAWRHRFRTLARDLKLDSRVVDDILGHAPSTAGEAYGTVSLKIKAETIAAMPAWPSGRAPPDVASSRAGNYVDGNDLAVRQPAPTPVASEP